MKSVIFAADSDLISSRRSAVGREKEKERKRESEREKERVRERKSE